MTTLRPSGSIQTSVLVSSEFFKLAKENNIKFSEALRIGLAIMLGDKGIIEYDNNLNILRKMRLFQKQAEEALQKVNELEAKYNGN